jgi:regulator of replication initiation timing
MGDQKQIEVLKQELETAKADIRRMLDERQGWLEEIEELRAQLCKRPTDD